jgi:hypothetical protein
MRWCDGIENMKVEEGAEGLLCDKMDWRGVDR